MSDKLDMKFCPECKISKPIADFAKSIKQAGGFQGYCRSCSTKHRREWLHKTQRSTPIENAITTGCYFGVQVAERKLVEIFKNAKHMPYANPGYDYICGKGFKIDVKSSCLLYRKHRGRILPHWQFNIGKNLCADYFFCIAYSDRKSQKIEHIWLIPGKRINYVMGLYISPSSECQTKWKEYELEGPFQ